MVTVLALDDVSGFVRHAPYVLGNYAVHLERAGVQPRGAFDACSSAMLTELACAPASWLLRVGWKRASA